MVDFHRTPNRKDDDTGWHGPFKVLESTPSDGNVKIQIGENKMLVGYKDLRHSMYTHLLWLLLIKPNDALTTVLNYISSLPRNKPASFGFTRDGKHLMKASRTHPKVHLALRYVLRNCFHIPRVQPILKTSYMFHNLFI